MEPLIYIEQKEKDEATLLLKGLTNPNVRKRVFVNALGAELLMKYLAQEGISVANVYNMHNIFKIREEFDIADVMLPNVHIDVRVVYDKDVIFIPKSHFANNLVPDVYVVFNMAQDSTHVDFLGFIKPENIDKSKQNSDYYFVDKDQLIHPFEFIEFVRNFEGNTTEVFSENLYSDAISLIDNDINSTKKQELIDALKKSAALREEMIEFDNFEWLSYNASKEEIIESVTEEPVVVDEFDIFEEKDDFGFDDNLPEVPAEDLAVAETTGEGEEIIEEVADTIIEDEATTDEVLNIADDVDSIEMPEDVSVDFENDMSIDTQETDEMSEDVSVNFDDDISIDTQETDEMPEDVSINFDEDISLDTNETDDISELEISNDINNSELDADVDELDADTEPEVAEPAESAEPATEVDGFSEELETLTDIVDTTQDSTEDTNASEDSETTEDLVDLLSLSSVESPAEDVPNYVEEENVEDLENLVSLEEINAGLDDQKEETSFETSGTEELMELEAYNNSSVEEPEITDSVQEPVPETDVSQIESFENTTVISSSNQTPGEIPIDINVQEQEDLGVLYDENTAEIENETVKAPEKGKKAVVVAAAAAVVLAASAAYFVINNNKQSEVAETPTFEEPEVQPPAEEQQVPEDKVVATVTKNADKTVVEQKPATVQPKPIESAYLSIKKMGWSVPDYVSYNDGFKRYLQTLGKSLRLALDSDLLLATEYPYSDQIFVDINLSNTGSVNKVTISKSSGSKQIDDIVLRTVKETSNVVKAPAGVVVGDKLQITLKIYL